jgi:dipeptidyl aminopeptidase/acylaminoacyl peptidase
VAIDATTGTQSVLLESSGLSDVSASADGRNLAVITSQVGGVVSALPRIALFAIETRELSTAPGFDPLQQQMDGYPAWSPDGALLAYVAQTEHSNEIRVLDLAKGSERTVYSSDGALVSLDWAPDGQRVITIESSYPDAETSSHYALEIQVETGEAKTVFGRDDAGTQVYSSADASLITEVSGEGAKVTARTWQRSDDDSFALSSRVPLGEDEGLVGAGELDIPLCARTRP